MDETLPAPGDRIERYQVLAVLGEGATARVYRVRHEVLGTEHALKVLFAERRVLVERFLQEARIQARLRHPHIVAVTDVLQHQGRPCLVMDLVEGPTLAGWLAAHGAMPWPEAVRLLQPVVAAVAHAHGHRVLHRDLKPGNILLTRDQPPLAKVADFGLAKVHAELARPGQTRDAVALGTPGFMAPEQWTDAAHVDERADIYSLCAVLYTALAARAPITGASVAELRDLLDGRLPRLEVLAPACPPPLADLVHKGLATEPDDRWDTADALLAALTASTPAPSPAPKGGPEAMPEGVPGYSICAFDTVVPGYSILADPPQGAPGEPTGGDQSKEKRCEIAATSPGDGARLERRTLAPLTAEADHAVGPDPSTESQATGQKRHLSTGPSEPGAPHPAYNASPDAPDPDAPDDAPDVTDAPDAPDPDAPDAPDAAALATPSAAPDAAALATPSATPATPARAPRGATHRPRAAWRWWAAGLVVGVAVVGGVALRGEVVVPPVVELPALELHAGDTLGVGAEDERPVELRTLAAFGLDRTEVATRSYQDCVAAGACTAPAWVAAPADYEGLTAPDQPIVGVTWEQAQAYCAWKGGRLPTEWEWEAAATWSAEARAAQDKRPWPWGEAAPDCAVARFQGCGAGTVAVDALPASASAFGAEQLVGNAWEWTASRYPARRTLFRRPAARYVLRGGAFDSAPDYLRPTFRRHATADDARPNHGFRCAYDR